MRKIYFNNNVITFALESEMAGDFYIKYNTSIDITKMLQKLELSNSITINGDNIEAVYSKFCSFFKLVDAAGGVVEGTGGSWMMMKRNGKWDLPKGHREIGEDIEACALREVEEECGISNLNIIRHLTTTQHIYRLNDVWILKSTYWYLMESSYIGELIPQIEEGITEVRWVEQGEISSLLENSYQTIIEIFTNHIKLT